MSKAWRETHIIAQNPRNSSVPSAGKVMLMLFWYFNGPSLKHYPYYR